MSGSSDDRSSIVGGVSGLRAGVFSAIAAYGLWGFMPLFFLLMEPASGIEIVAFRIICSVLLCVLFVAIGRRWGRLRVILGRPRSVLILGLAGLLVFVNWSVYLYAVLTGHVIEAALGYFINPLVTILLGVMLFRERLSKVQWFAVVLSAIAICVLAIDYGRLPWLSLTLALSFALYGLIKKMAGSGVDALSGMAIESVWLLPVAVGLVIWLALRGELTFVSGGVAHFGSLLLAGPITVVPLMMFAAAARRLPLSYIGLAQYLAPVLQFLIGYLVLHEYMSVARWAGFSLVWVALTCITVEVLRNHALRSSGKI